MQPTRSHVLALFASAVAAPAPLRAQTAAPKLPPQPTAAEQPFVAKLQQDIPARFATVPAATRAGYFQYTAEDRTGAISYVNLKVWNSTDLDVPNQLWYDVKGRLLGVDYTVLESQSPKPPATLFGFAIDPSRWVHRGPHIHWGFILPDATLKLGAMPVQKFTDAGGTPSETDPGIPSNKAALVKAGVPGLTTPDQVTFVFLHPAMWDLVVWVLPNPDGAFADANPNVTPSSKT